LACWSCERPEGEGVLCEKCGAIQPPSARTHFEMLGLPARYDLDPGTLEARYKELSRKLHPDRFARADARARLFSLQQSTAVNDAVRTLRNPTRRAEYLLRLSGIEIDGDRAGNGARTVLPEQALLAEMMELGEAISDARLAGHAADITRMVQDVRARRERAMAAVERGFAQAADPAPGDDTLQRIGADLVALRYYDRLLADAEGKDHAP